MNADPNNINFPQILEYFDKFAVSARIRGELQCGKKYRPLDWSPELAKKDDIIRCWNVLSTFKGKTTYIHLMKLNPKHVSGN